MEADGCDLYHRVLELMGGDYAQLSAQIKNAEAKREQTEQVALLVESDEVGGAGEDESAGGYAGMGI